MDPRLEGYMHTKEKQFITHLATMLTFEACCCEPAAVPFKLLIDKLRTLLRSDGKTAAVSVYILLEWNDNMTGALPTLQV